MEGGSTVCTKSDQIQEVGPATCVSGWCIFQCTHFGVRCAMGIRERDGSDGFEAVVLGLSLPRVLERGRREGIDGFPFPVRVEP